MGELGNADAGLGRPALARPPGKNDMGFSTLPFFQLGQYGTVWPSMGQHGPGIKQGALLLFALQALTAHGERERQEEREKFFPRTFTCEGCG